MARNRHALRKVAREQMAADPHGPDPSRFDNLKNVAIGGIFVVFGITVGFNGFGEMWTRSSAPYATIIFYTRIIFFCELVILMLRWIIATHHEMDLWALWLVNPFTKQDIYTALFGLSVVLGLLLAFPHKILFISGFMTLYLLINYWTQWLANNHFARALQRTRLRAPSTTKSDVLIVMEHFWLKRPQLARIVTMMYFSSIAFSLAFAGEVQPEPQKTRFQLSAYLTLIATIFVGELVIAWWRHKLDQGIMTIIDSKE